MPRPVRLLDYNSHVPSRRILIPALILTLVATACGRAPTPAPTIALPVLVLPTLPSTPSALPARTPLPPTPAPTLPPIDGLTTTQLNVRLDPSTGSTALGILPASSAVQVVSRDATGTWYQILYSKAAEGTGWVSSAYVQVPDRDAVPVISGAGIGPSGVLAQQVNVRSGPGTSFNPLGTLNAGDVLTLIARNPEGTWLQVSFPSGPNGRGWVAAAFVQTGDASSLPILGGQGEILGTGTPTALPASPTPTILPAIDDGDSASSPGANLLLSPSTAGAAQFSSDLSSPSGDSEDWIRFVSVLPRLAIRLDCAGNALLSVEISTEAGAPIEGWPGLACGGESGLEVVPGQAYLLHFTLPSGVGSLVSTRFTVFIAALH